MRRITRTSVLCLVLGIAAVFAKPADALPILVNFTGTVTSSGMPQYPTGTAITSSLTFQSSTLDLNGAPNLGEFDGAITAWSMTIGSDTFTTTTGDIETNTTGTTRTMLFRGINFTPSIGGWLLDLVWLQLSDTAPFVLTPDALPTAFSLGDVSQGFTIAGFWDGVPCDDGCPAPGLNFNLTGLTAAPVSAVPEPATLGLVAGGFAALAARRRRAKR